MPLDGIGLQYHIHGREPFQYLTEEALRRIGALGLTAHISELDDRTSPFGGMTEESLAKQGQAFQTIASACQAVPACTRVTTWGASDAWSWRGLEEMAVALDAGYGDKPAWAALQQELRPVTLPSGQPPSAPGTIHTGVKHDRGTFLVSWEPALDLDGDPLTYRLEHRDADDAGWSPVATAIRGLDYRFAAGGFIEQQGTWRYRLRAADPAAAGAYRDRTGGGGVVIVDRVSPYAPVLVADRAAAWGDWYRDAVRVSFTDGGDPILPDGSPGSGLNPTSVPAPQLITQTGTSVVSGSGTDRAGNPSPVVTGSYRVDADAPSGWLACPAAPVSVGSTASATWQASDVGAGLAGAAAGGLALDTSRAGAFTASHDVVDNVGHAVALSCEYRVEEAAPTPTSTSTLALTATSTVTASPTAGAEPVSSAFAWPDAASASVAVKPRARRPVRRGRVRLVVACRGAPCDGRLTVAPDRSRAFLLRPGERAVLPFTLTRRERRTLARRDRLALRVSVRLAGAPAADSRRLVVRA